VPAVSKEALEVFTSTVQPILHNHCSAAACHGPSAPSSFRLARLPYGRLTNQRTTQQNLRAVLRLVDREHPSASPLLTMPLKPHGKAKDAVFKARDAARYRHLVAWVNQVAAPTSGVADGTALEKQPPLLQAKEPEMERPSPAALPSGQEATQPNGLRAPAFGSGQQSLGKPLPTPQQPLPQAFSPSGVVPGGFVPRDAFDPEIFNRRHFPGRSR
jgi:hypothetical protein